MVLDQEFETLDLNINMGPQHPSTHGVFRMVLSVDGELIVEDPRLGVDVGAYFPAAELERLFARPDERELVAFDFLHLPFGLGHGIAPALNPAAHDPRDADLPRILAHSSTLLGRYDARPLPSRPYPQIAG